MQTLLQNYILRILIHLLGDHQSDGSGLITPIYDTLVGGAPFMEVLSQLTRRVHFEYGQKNRKKREAWSLQSRRERIR